MLGVRKKIKIGCLNAKIRFKKNRGNFLSNRPVRAFCIGSLDFLIKFPRMVGINFMLYLMEMKFRMKKKFEKKDFSSRV